MEREQDEEAGRVVHLPGVRKEAARMEKRPMNMPWKGLDRALMGGNTNEEIRAMFPGEELDDEWLEERRALVLAEEDKKSRAAGAAAQTRAAFVTPEYLMRMEDAIGVLAETIDNADDLYRLAEAAHIVANAKAAEWDIQMGVHGDRGVPF